MNKNTVIFLSIVLIVVLGIIFWLGGGQNGISDRLTGEKEGFLHEDALPQIEGGNRETIKNNVATPEKGGVAPVGVAVPEEVFEYSGSDGETSSLRLFRLRAENGRYSPDTVVVNEGDPVTIVLTAVDRDYDIFFPDFGVFKTAPQGEEIQIQFQAYPFGQYSFYCQEACRDEVQGTLIVNPR